MQLVKDSHWRHENIIIVTVFLMDLRQVPLLL